MFSKKSNSEPLGVPLGDLLLMLQPTSIKASLKSGTLTARHEHYTTHIRVVEPEKRETEDRPIEAVVRVTTELPKQLLQFFMKPGATVAMNKFAALGALFSDRGSVYVGSRLTIYEAENAWPTLHLPLLLFTTICGVEAILGAVRRSMNNQDYSGGTSDWTESDFAQVENSLSRFCVCSTGALGFTAEFGLSEGAISAAAGHRTALFRLKADQPHPELGGGLFCVLEIPYLFRNDQRLREVCEQLNNMEMAAGDLPPHFGAWCEGSAGHNPAYISFFPNALHRVSGIALNAAYWAANRTQWANQVIPSLDK